MWKTSRRRDFRNAVIIVTGATAGVGRATARAFAREGAKIGLLARDGPALEETRAEIEAAGGRALCLPADIADPEAVEAAAARCEAALGPIDVWVNNAMVTVFAPVADLTEPEIRRVTEVTYLGTVHGTMAALRRMRPRGRGVIVQVGSSLAYRGLPLQAGYCGAKHAIRGFTDALRAELLHDGSGVRLTAVHLPAVNTPQFDWARTRRARAPRPAGPVYRPQVAARAILHAARHPRREYWLGGQTPLVILGNMVAPGLLDRMLAATGISGQETDTPVREDRPDNLYRPGPAALHRSDGRFAGESRRGGLLFPGETVRAAAVGAVALLAGAAGYAAAAARRRR